MSKDCKDHHKPLRTLSNLDVDWVLVGRVYLAKHGDDEKGIAVGNLTVFKVL